MALAPGQEEIQKLQAAGFTIEEIGQWQDEQRRTLTDAGFGQAEVDEYFGRKPFNEEAVRGHVEQSFAAQREAEAPAEGGAKPAPREAKGLVEHLEAGLQISVSGLLTRGEAPSLIRQEDSVMLGGPSMLERAMFNLGAVGGDVPFMVGGFMLGGGTPVTGTGGAFALPAGLRAVIMDAYTNGEVADFGDFWNRATRAILETVKGEALGMATGGAGVVAKAALPAAAPKFISATVPTAAELATMVSVGAALEGRIPRAQDFLDAAFLIGGFRGATAVAAKLRNVYARTGLKPQEVATIAERDPTVRQDLMAKDVEVPAALKHLDEVVNAMIKRGKGKEKIEPEIDPVKLREQAEIADAMVDAALKGKREPQMDKAMLEASDVLRAETKIEPQFPEGTVFHGTAFKFERLKPNEREGAIFFTNNRSVAEEYALAGERPEARVIPAKIDLQNPLVVEGRGRLWYELGTQRIIEKAKADGHDGVIFKNVVDTVRSGKTDKTSDVYAIFSEKTVKQHAEYKPPAKPPVEPPTGDGGGKSPGDIVGSRIVLGKPPRGPRSEWEQTYRPWNEVYRQYVDDLHPIAVLEKALTGEKIKETAESPYDLARLSRGAYGKADHMLEHATFDVNTYANTGKSLRDVLAPVLGKKLDGNTEILFGEKNGLEAFKRYAVSERVIELEARGVETGVDVVAARQVAKGGKSDFAAPFRELVNYSDRVLDNTLVASGILSKETAALVKDMNRSFIPMYRVFGEEGFGSVREAGRGLRVRNPIRQIKGSESKIVDPIESIIKNTYMYTTLADRNLVGLQFHKLVREHPEAAAALGIERVKAEIRPIEVTEPEVAKFLEEHGIDPKAAEAFTIFRARKAPLAENEIRFFEDGKPIVYRVPKEIAEAFKGLDNEAAGMLLKMAAAPAAWLRAGVTLTPEFMLRNVSRDQISAFVFSKHGFVPVLTALQGAGALLSKPMAGKLGIKVDERYLNWLKSGGANSAFVSLDRQYLQAHVFKLSKDTGLIDKTWNIVRSPFELARLTGEVIENSTRIGEFGLATKKGTSKAQVQAGGMDAREVTLDFQRAGAKLKALGLIRMTAFLNPAIQGIDRTVRAFIDRPVESSVKALLAITLPSVLLWAVNRDDPRWREVKEWEKDVFWIVMTDDWQEAENPDEYASFEASGLGKTVNGVQLVNKGTVYKIPKNFEQGIIFGSLPERVLEAYFTDNPEAFKEFQHTLFEAFVPPVMPQFAAPVVEQFANRSFFTDNPIVPSYLQDLLPEYRYTEYTSESAKLLGAMIAAIPGMSTSNQAAPTAAPAVIDNYIQAWTGGMGRYVIQIADYALTKAGVVPDPVKPAKTLADMPIIKAFVVRYPSATAQSIQNFYDRYYERKQHYDTVMELAQRGDAEAAAKLVDMRPDAMVQLDGIREALTSMTRVVQMINKNPDFTPDEKRQLIDGIYYQMIALSREGNTALDAVDELLGSDVEETTTR